MCILLVLVWVSDNTLDQVLIPSFVTQDDEELISQLEQRLTPQLTKHIKAQVTNKLRCEFDQRLESMCISQQHTPLEQEVLPAHG